MVMPTYVPDQRPKMGVDEPVDKRQRYIARVHEVCPDLLVETVTHDVGGQNNDILVVNDEVIFRFPKYDEGVKRLEIETAILTGIQRYLTTASVPNPIYVSLAKTVGQAFMGSRSTSRR